MRTTTDRWRRTFWLAGGALGVGLFALDMGLGAVSVIVTLASGAVALVSFLRLYALPTSRQPYIR